MICRRCGQDKYAGNFIWKPDATVAHGQKCKECMREIRNEPAYKEKQRGNHLKRLYGIDENEYQRFFEKQNGKCAICNQISDADGKNSRLHVDHDHTTKKVRGLLCYRCNIAIGFLSEDLERIYKILDYLNLHSEVK